MYLLKGLRMGLGMSQSEAAHLIGVDVNTIRRAERGENLSPKTWYKIIEWYGIDKTPEYDEILEEALSATIPQKEAQRASRGVKNTKKA